jgi:phosphate transport system substrate-binding protein
MALSYFTEGDDSVVKLSIDGVEANEENITAGKFPVWAYEHMYTKGEPKPLVKAFLDYMMSDEVQSRAVSAQGYISEANMTVQRDAKGEQSNK